MDKVVYETTYANLMRTAEMVEEFLNKKCEHNSKKYIELEALIRNVKGKILEAINTSNYTDVEITSKGLYEILKYVLDRLDLTWDDKYEVAKVYYEHCGNLLIEPDFRTNNGYERDENGIFELGEWISTQRKSLKIVKSDTADERKIKEERRLKLDQIGMVWNGRKALFDIEWEQRYKEAQKYYEEKGHLSVPQKYVQNGIKLGVWIGMQRNRLKIKDGDTFERRKDKEKKRARLELIGMIWDGKKALFDEEWEQWYKEAMEYYEKNGDLIVLCSCEQNGQKLGDWISEQRRKLQIKDSDTPEQRKNKENRRSRLEQIGMVWDGRKARNDEIWKAGYKEAQKYYEKKGDLIVPQKWEQNGQKLGVWIGTQRVNLQIKENDTPEQRRDKEYKRAKLEQIGMVWDGHKALADQDWEERYKEAQNYYEKEGDLLVPDDYRENGRKLGSWISLQRMDLQLKDDDTPEQRKDKENKRSRLEQIGMVWDGRKARSDKKWEERYKEAQDFYEENGHLVVPRDYEKNGKKLESWIAMQRNGLKIREDDTPEQRKDKERKRARLELIGMVWDVVENKYDVLNLCIKYGINGAKNSEIISNISSRELKSKIEYLSVQGIPYVTNGVLHEIFNMSSRDIEKKYGVNLAFIITNFYVDDKGKGLD